MSLIRTSGGFQPHHIEQSIEDYQKCRRRPREQRWVEWDSGCIRFHVTFYHIRSYRNLVHSLPWRHGSLHSDLSNRLLCESAYTVSSTSAAEDPDTGRSQSRYY